jgi:HEAT repeat protein
LPRCSARRAAEALGECKLLSPPETAGEDARTVALHAVQLAFERLAAATDNEMPSTRLAAYKGAHKLIGRPEWAGEGEGVARRAFVPLIRKAFGDSCWNIRVEAAKWAAEWHNEDFTKELTDLLKDPDWVVREKLAGALADRANKRGEQIAKDARADGNENKLTDEQVDALVLAEKQSTIEMLKTLLDDERIQVRWAAIQALHKLKTGQAFEALTGHSFQHWHTLTN